MYLNVIYTLTSRLIMYTYREPSTQCSHVDKVKMTCLSKKPNIRIGKKGDLGTLNVAWLLVHMASSD